MGKTFISYRRKDWTFAQRLAERLDARIKDGKVFIDVRMEGEDFEDIILQEINACDLFILVVSERTFDLERIRQAGDWVRREVACALNLGKPVALALLEDTSLPEAQLLPDDIRRIVTKQGVSFYPTFFDEGIEQLAKHCVRIAPDAFSLRDTAEMQPNPASQLQWPEKAGIVQTYENLETAKTDIRRDFQAAKNILLFFQIGRREFNDLFWSLSKQKTAQPDSRFRVLHAAISSPFLSEQRAEKRYGPQLYLASFREWQSALTHLQNQIMLLKREYGLGIEGRAHHEPFLWRVYLFDDVGYISGYLFAHENIEKAPILKIADNGSSLYAIMDNYFEYLWKKYDPSNPMDSVEKWQDW